MGVSRLTIWNWVLLGYVWLFLSKECLAVEAVDFKLAHQQEGSRAFTGIDGLNIAQLQTHFTTPLTHRSAKVGRWTLGATLSEYRYLLTGSSSGNRRFYRVSAPIQYFPRQVGRLQHQWHFEPSHYSDESLISQTRDDLEYAWRMKYWVNRKVSWLLGFRKDSRFGSSQVYPVFGLESQPKKGILHHWVFPDFYTQIRINKKLTIRAYGQIEGGNWKFLQQDGSTASFGLSQWRIGLKGLLKTNKTFHFTGSVGWATLGEGSLAGSDGTLTDSFFFSLGIETPLDAH